MKQFLIKGSDQLASATALHTTLAAGIINPMTVAPTIDPATGFVTGGTPSARFVSITPVSYTAAGGVTGPATMIATGWCNQSSGPGSPETIVGFIWEDSTTGIHLYTALDRPLAVPAGPCQLSLLPGLSWGMGPLQPMTDISLAGITS